MNNKRKMKKKDDFNWDFIVLHNGCDGSGYTRDVK
jgi:hypothetical protein